MLEAEILPGMYVCACCSAFQCVGVCCSVLQIPSSRTYWKPKSCLVCMYVRVAVRWSVLQCAADSFITDILEAEILPGMYVCACCSVFQCVGVCCNVFQIPSSLTYWKQNFFLVCMYACVAVLKCVTVCCSVLQCVVVCCRFLHHGHTRSRNSSWYVCTCALQCVAVRCSVLQCVGVCCSVLQCVAVCCRFLYH